MKISQYTSIRVPNTGNLLLLADTVSGTNYSITVKDLAAVVSVGGVYYGAGAPVSAPTNTGAGAIYYDTDTYQTYFWNVTGQTW